MRLLVLATSLAVLAACNNASDAPQDTVEAPSPSVTGQTDNPLPTAPAETSSNTQVSNYERITFDDRTATPEEIELCEAAGGEVRPAGRAGFDNCIQTFDDAGDACSDTSDCTGRCLVDGEMVEAGTEVTGQCAEDDERFGCYQEIEDGKAKPGICVD